MKISFLIYEPLPELAELARRMERIAALGYHGIELSAFHPPTYPAEEIVRLSEKFRLPVVSLLSGWSYANEGFCLASPDADMRRRAVERLTDYAAQAARLSAVVVVGLMQGFRSDEPDEAKANDRIVECFQAAGKAAHRHGATIVIE